MIRPRLNLRLAPLFLSALIWLGILGAFSLGSGCPVHF